MSDAGDRDPDAAACPVTPDGRYLVVRGRLWRRADPTLLPERRDALVRTLMEARRAKGVAIRTGNDAGREAARRAVDAAKRALGERGPVWWDDGAPDENRRLARNTRYAAWWAERENGGPAPTVVPPETARDVLLPSWKE